MFSVRLHWKSELNTYRVEASWKLGQWDLLEDYLSSGTHSQHFHYTLKCAINKTLMETTE